VESIGIARIVSFAPRTISENPRRICDPADVG
jgi:hypothetical protein